jgi:hypothetical protein
VRSIIHVLIAASFVGISPPAQAQHYRVTVYLAESRRVLSLDFSPCIPAEGSGCGGFLTGTAVGPIDAQSVSPVKRLELSPDSSVGIRIVGDTIALIGGAGRVKVVFDPQRTPVAVTVASDSRYAFAVLAGKRSAVKAQVRMFDLSTRTGVASLLIEGVPLGVDVTR